MTQSLTTAVAEVAEVVAAISGIGAAPATPQENINERVFALTYLMTAETAISETGPVMQHLATIAVDLLTPHTVLADNIAALLPILDLVATAFMREITTVSAFFDGSIDTFENLRVEFLPFYPYSGVECVGYRVMLEGVKQKINL